MRLNASARNISKIWKLIQSTIRKVSKCANNFMKVAELLQKGIYYMYLVYFRIKNCISRIVHYINNLSITFNAFAAFCLVIMNKHGALCM